MPYFGQRYSLILQSRSKGWVFKWGRGNNRLYERAPIILKAFLLIAQELLDKK